MAPIRAKVGLALRSLRIPFPPLIPWESTIEKVLPLDLRPGHRRAVNNFGIESDWNQLDFKDSC